MLDLLERFARRLDYALEWALLLEIRVGPIQIPVVLTMGLVSILIIVIAISTPK